MESTEVGQEEIYEDKYDYLITEEQLKHIHPDLNHNFPSPTMNSGIMSTFHNDPETIIDDAEDFPIPQLTLKWTQVKNNSSNYHQSYQ